MGRGPENVNQSRDLTKGLALLTMRGFLRKFNIQ